MTPPNADKRRRKPVTPRQPTGPRQPAPPVRQDADQVRNSEVYKPKTAVLVLWIAPELRERYPDMPLSLHEALQVGLPPGQKVEIPFPPVSRDPWWTFEPSWISQAEREAGS
jgi:hypothetical protein